jgi:TamB, inner membrane protein subunit of TAM complex
MLHRSRPTPRARAALAVLFVVASAAALVAQEEPRIPLLDPLPPIEARLLRAVEGPITTTITDVSFRTSLGHDVGAARIEIVADPASIGRAPIHARLIRLVEPRLISPVDTITTPFDPFIELPVPRLRVDRLILEDGTFGTLAHPSQFAGRWLWLQQNVDVEVRDVVLGGEGRESLRLTHASMAGELKGSPLRVTHAEALVARDGVLDLAATVGLGVSEVAVEGTVQRSGAVRFDVRTTPLAFAEARAFVTALPDEGRAEIDATLAGGGDEPFTIALRHMIARVRESAVAATGTIRTGAGGAVDDFILHVTRLASADLDSVFGVALPGGGVWHGAVRADGPLATGIAIAGALERGTAETVTAEGTNGGELPRFVLDGTIRTEPEPTVVLAVEAERLPVRDGTAHASLRIAGPVDSLTVAGRVRGGAIATIEELVADVDALIVDPGGAAPRHVRATSDIVAIVGPHGDADAATVSARAEGTAVLVEGGALNASIVADSIPFDLLPLPSSIDSVRGAMRADVAVTGTIDAPVIGGVLDVRDGAFRVPAARLAVHDLAGPITVRAGVATLDALAARANGGTVDVEGTVRLTGERTADVTIVARDVALLADDSVTVVASGEVRATGALEQPLLAADARLTLPRSEGALPLATARATVDLARDGALAGELRADSLPLAALPATTAVRDLRGAVRALVRLGGTVDAPSADGRVELRGAGGTIVRTGTVLDSLRGDAVVGDGRVVLDGVTGTVGGGALMVEGEARIADGPKTLDVHATIDRGTVVATDSAVVVASVDMRAAGALDQPAIAGTVTLHDGWVHEDNFVRREPIDPAEPPYDELIERVPWLADSRLRQGAAQPLTAEERLRPRTRIAPPEAGRRVVESIEAARRPRSFTARVAIDIERPFMLVDEDSEIHGDGRIFLISDTAGTRAEGIYRLTGGYYAQYGAVFEIRGGAFWFAGDGFAPRVSMRSEHRFDAPLGTWLTAGARVLDRFPPLEFRALGSQEAASEEVRRLSLLPETRTELGALLLYDQPVERVRGLEHRRFWPPDDGGDLFGEAAATRGAVLLYNYIANESYDYLPLERAWGRAGAIAIGPEWPGRITIGPYLQGGLRVGDLFTTVTQPTIGGTAPGIRLRYRLGAPELLAFSEPYFRSTPFGADGSVFTHRRRTGVGVRFGWEW